MKGLIMDLEEVYLRQIDQNLKRQNELQEITIELLQSILNELSNGKTENVRRI